MFNCFGGGGEEGPQNRQKRFRTSRNIHSPTAAASNLSVPIGGGGGGGDPYSSSFHRDSSDSDTCDTSIDELEQASIKLNQLSIQERTQVESELHGIDEEINEETPDFINKSLQELDCAIKKLLSHYGDPPSIEKEGEATASSSSPAYFKAMEISPEYVEKIKIQCLRTELFDCKEAAVRLVRYFDRKRELFGNDDDDDGDEENLLVRDIRLQDLTSEENEALKQGLIILLPHRDRAGRGIWVVRGSINQMYTTRQVMRVFWYIMTVAGQDSNCSKRGTVGIYYGFNQTKTTPGRPREWWLSWRATSLRIVACHFCGGNANGTEILTPAVQAFFAVANRFTVCRLRMHYGPLIECLYRLLTFGLPVNEALPVTSDGNIQLKFHHEMIETWRMREELADLSSLLSIEDDDENDYNDGNTSSLVSSSIITTADDEAAMPPSFTAPVSSLSTKSTAEGTVIREGSIISESDNKFIEVNPDGPSPNPASSMSSCDNNEYVIPGSLDILMGRGLHPKSRPGAMRLHELIGEHTSQYNQATKPEKLVISQQILAQLKGQGCRFLNYSKERGYEICDDNVARKKIAHGFRNQRLKDRNNGSYPPKQPQKQRGGGNKNKRSIED